MRMKKITILAFLLLVFAGGCYESPLITWYEPHVYKGSDDPLLDKLEAGELQEQLRERFRSVQTDR